MKKSKAITIVELIVVIGLISIITVISFVSFSPLKNSMDLNGQKKNIITDLRQAQSNATTDQFRHLIRFSPPINPTDYSLIRINEDLSETVIWTKNLPPNLTATITAPNSEFIFSADGSVIHSGEIELKTNLGKTKKIIINPIGNIKEQ